MLARFGCEDRSFTLEIPPEVEEEQELADGETFELTRSAFEFLYNLAINAPSWKAREAWDDLQNLKDTPTNAVLDDKIPARKFVHNYQGGEMTWGDLKDILSVMPDVTHPWSYAPICQVCIHVCMYVCMSVRLQCPLLSCSILFGLFCSVPCCAVLSFAARCCAVLCCHVWPCSVLPSTQ